MPSHDMALGTVFVRSGTTYTPSGHPAKSVSSIHEQKRYIAPAVVHVAIQASAQITPAVG